MNPQPYLKSFVQRNRKVTNKQQILLDKNQCLINNFEDLSKDIHNYKKLNLEIGFGKGDFLLKNALLSSEELFVGSEIFLSGVFNVLQNAEDKQLQNIRVFNKDVRILLSQINKPIFSKVFILFPDPWPKVRHNKRRIINRFLIDKIFDLLQTEGQLHIVTDINDYAEWVNELFKQDSRFKILANKDKLTLQDLNTSYCKKALEKEHIIHVFGFYK